ncbi:MFS transporter [Streptomyces sp. NPDC051954]|uniref:MFS transporter n=1 Tax=unclassified Streptomyces TaxID=2593676 RepID=UPI00342384A3
MTRETAPSPTQDPAAGIGGRIDRIPAPTRRHLGLIAMLAGLFMFDIVDLGSFAYVAPVIREQWDLSIETIGILTSTAFLGMVFGGLIGGRLADRFGRRPVVLIAVTFFSLACLASALATGPVFLGVTRFLTGLGLQAATSAILVMASEMFPKPFRGRAMSIILGFALIGAPMIALVARIVVPMGTWQWIYVAGSGGVIIALIGIKVLPESPRWLASHGCYEQADALVTQYEEEYVRTKRRELPAPIVDTFVPVATKTSTAAIFSRGLIGRTLAATAAFCILILLNYGLPQWLPVILIDRGYPQDDALTFAFILSFAYVIGAFLSALIIDRFERKTTITACAVILIGAYLAVGFIPSVPVLLIAGFLAGLLSQAISAAMYSYVPEMFPVEVRGIGAGFANGMGRVAGVFSGVIVAAVIAAFATEGVFVYLAVVALAMALVIQAGPRIGIREARKRLLHGQQPKAVEPERSDDRIPTA